MNRITWLKRITVACAVVLLGAMPVFAAANAGAPWFPGIPGFPGWPSPQPPQQRGSESGFPKGFKVPINHATGRPVTGWGGDPSGRTDGGKVTHIPIIFVHGATRSAQDWDKERQYFLSHGYTPNELWAFSYGYGTMQKPDSNTENVPTLRDFVASVISYLQTNVNPNVKQVNIIAHSLGGTIARKWMQEDNAYAQVHSLITIASPHHGLGACPDPNNLGCQELRPGSKWLQELNAGGEAIGPTRYMTIYDGTGQHDFFYRGNMKDSPALKGAENHPYNVERGTRLDHANLANGTVELQFQWLRNALVEDKPVPVGPR